MLCPIVSHLFLSRQVASHSFVVSKKSAIKLLACVGECDATQKQFRHFSPVVVVAIVVVSATGEMQRP